MLTTLKWFLAIVIIILMAIAYNLEFKAAQKYYPDLTLWEYSLLQDKLRITSKDRSRTFAPNNKNYGVKNDEFNQ